MDSLATILAPLKYEQARRHSAFAKLDSERHQKLIEEVAAERAGYVESDSMPSLENLAYFDQQLAELNGLTKPMALLQDAAPGRLTLAIERSPDSTLLATFDDLSFQSLVGSARTCRGSLDIELLTKSAHQQIFDGAFLERIHEAPVVSPVITMVAIVRPETAAKFLSSSVPVVAGFADCCLVFRDTEDLPTDENLVANGGTVASWQRAVTRLMASREETARIIGLGPEAGEVLAGFASRVAAESLKAPADVNRFLHHSTRLASKLALLKHASLGDASTPMPGDIAARAVTIVESSTKHRLALLQSNIKLLPVKDLRTRVLEIILALGPISPRNICRHCHKLKIAALGPVLWDLLQAGQVGEHDGRYAGVNLTELQAVAS
jgi:hypothetical protein